MTINNRFCILIGMVFILLSLSLASAQTLVAGKIYDSDYSETVADVSIAVACNSNTLNTNSLDDGTYAVRFDSALCSIGDSVKVSATKDNLAGEGSGSVSECDRSQNCEERLVSIINLNLKEAQAPSSGSSGSSSGGGGGGAVYFCGNGKCDSGENERTCAKDCKVAQIVANSTETNAGAETAEEIVTGETINGNSTFLSGITGAVVGVLGNIKAVIAIIFLAILIALIIVSGIIRKRKKRLI